MSAPVHAKTYDLPLRSKVIDWLETTSQKSATAQQWLGMLNNLQGVRTEEKVLSGLTNGLAEAHENDPDEMFSKQALIKCCERWLRECHPVLQSYLKHAFRPGLGVKQMTDQLPKRVEAKARRFVEKAQTCYQHPSIGYWIIRTGYEDLATTAPNWIVLDHKGKMLLSHERHGGWFPTALEAFDEMHRAIRSRYNKFGGERSNTLFDEYAFLGGNNYREWFICLPDWPLPYRDGHFNLQQLLVHIRTTERLDHNGVPLLMVEEIQSPWHADIRKHGSTADKDKVGKDDLVADAPFAKEWHELAIKAVIALAVQQNHTQIGFTTGKQQCERWCNMKGLLNLYDLDIPKCLKRIATQYDCTNDWATIATRRPMARVRRTPQGEWILQDANKVSIAPPVKNKDVALFFLNERSAPVKEQIRVLQVSTALKQAMKAGEIPLFGW
ncbi:MAG: hypothetical protein Q7U78_07430 [Gallionella sp.]|nr:hypothetical protein [Gallionella sp.]